MPGWKSLPDGLDPEIRAFTEELRRLLDHSGLDIAVVSERTGRERAVWDAYLDARRPVPSTAVVDFAELTGADTGDLATRWDRAGRAWVAARTAAGSDEGPDVSGARGVPASRDVREPRDVPESRGVREAPEAAREVPEAGQEARQDPRQEAGRKPRQEAGLEARQVSRPPGDDRTLQIRRIDPDHATHPGGPVQPPAQARPAGPVQPPATARTDRPARANRPARPARSRAVLLSVAGILAVLVVGAALLLVDLGGNGGADAPAAAPPATTTPPPTKRADLPPGVTCAGADCSGQDAEATGCGGDLATTVASTRVGSALVELRYSDTCKAAWARITGAAPGDTVTVEVASADRRATVTAGDGTAPAGTDAYTPMLAAASGADARACGTLADGREGCTARP
ncbi:DUF2690 domain-containing protein [Streptomyces sp. NPDC056549]|uniref:DUF2690 domain-containing protein n=1 Tax=Streptomyces sp. NPDC056549 TaxID=3345864 RepID=UPI003690731D